MSGQSTGEQPARGGRFGPFERLVATIALVSVATIALLGWIAWTASRGGPETCEPRQVAEAAMPSVVTIFVRSSGGSSGSGSGEFLDQAGHILTNNHVISAAVGGGVVTVLRPNGEELTATLVGRDVQTDLAVLKVDPVASVKPVRFGDVPVIGSPVFAIGAPLGLAETFTAGVVSGLGRSVRVPADNNTTALLVSAIQTDASINPGNSGGMLANCSGELVGVPTAGATANDSLGQPVAGSIGLGFAIPAAAAKRIADTLIKDGRVRHGDFGLGVVPVTGPGSTINPVGLYISSITAGGGAARAGLRQSDIITALDAELISSADQLQEFALTSSPGTQVEVTYRRAEAVAVTQVTLGPAP